MENEIIFSESQRFKQWWLWIILLGVDVLFLYIIFQQLVLGKPFGGKPMTNLMLVMTTGFILLLSVMFIYFRLDTQIKKDGIYVRFFPIQFTFRYYPWDTISKSFVREYNAILEFGGWGFRIGLFGKGKAFTMSGNNGLQLEFKDNKKLLIGTNKPDEVRDVLFRLKQLND